MRYRSTRDSSLRMPFSEVLLGGLSQDGGLYMPCEIPSLKIKDINRLENLSYQE